MASNKFNQRPVPRRRPAICHPPPETPYPIVPITTPRSLSGFFRWTDLDPALEHKPDLSSYIDLAQTVPHAIYHGTSPKNRFHVTAKVELQTAPDRFLVILHLWELGSWLESHSWSEVKVTFPFDTGLLTHTIIPSQDFRLARFME